MAGNRGADWQARAETIRIFGNEHTAGNGAFKESNDLAAEKFDGRGIQHDSRKGQAQDNRDRYKTFKDFFQVTLLSLDTESVMLLPILGIIIPKMGSNKYLFSLYQ